MGAPGILYGVGVGPGDPQLLTLKACEVIRSADVLAYPINNAGFSLSRQIAQDVIPDGSTELPFHLPMRVEREPARVAYDEAAGTISGHLEAGRSVAYLCVGDPLFYGSFMYMAARFGGGQKIEIIPGITSLSACTARTNTSIAGRNDILTVVPATLDEEALKTALTGADAAAIIKAGRHFEKVRSVLRELGLADRATVLESASGENERVVPVEEVPQGHASYFTTVLVRREELS